MSGTAQVQALCPRCYAELAPGASSCGRCGVALDDSLPGRKVAQGPFCPRCDRVEADGAGFTGVVGSGAAGSCEHCGTMLVEAPADRPAAPGAGPIAYEEVSRATDSWDLDRLIRAEAVDGWTLVDTTVDPAAPDRLLAHFRRALPAEDPRARGVLGGGAAAAPSAQGSKATRPPAATAAAPRSPEQPTPAAPSAGEPRAQAKAARLAAREARKERRGARRARKRDRLDPIFNGEHDWVRPIVELVLSIGLVLVKDLAIPLLLALMAVGREVLLALLTIFVGPNMRPSRRSGSGQGRR